MRLSLGIQGARRVAMNGDGKDGRRQRKEWIIKNLSIVSVTLTCSISRDVLLILEPLSWIRFALLLHLLVACNSLSF